MYASKLLTVILLLMLIILLPVVCIKKGWVIWRRQPEIAISLYSGLDRKIYRMSLEEYLVGVVAAEMPAKFGREALKAQAVAARTVAVRRLKRFGGMGCLHNPGVDFCDDPAENQAWLSRLEMRRRWPRKDFNLNYNRIKRAVYDTKGVIITYQNKPIDAVFHSTCGVGTAAAEEVWSHAIPYLQSVACGFDNHSRRLKNSTTYSWWELSRKLNKPISLLRQLTIRRISPRGRVLLLTAGSYQITGSEFRSALGLTSNYFRWREVKNGLEITATGYGHGVGLCQYGADGMGKKGWSYQQIIRHYYQGVTLSRINY